MIERRLYVFYTSRPCDKGEHWPVLYTDRNLAEQVPHRVSDIIEVSIWVLENVSKPAILPASKNAYAFFCWACLVNRDSQMTTCGACQKLTYTRHRVPHIGRDLYVGNCCVGKFRSLRSKRARRE